MHILIGLLLLLVIFFYFKSRNAQANPQGNDQPPAPAERQRPLAYRSGGLLFFRQAGGEIQQLHSDYVQEVEARSERSRQLHGWKQGTSFGIASGGGMRDFTPADAPITVTSALFDAAGNLYYFLKDQGMGGLFRRNAETGSEFRLMLKQHLELNDLCLSPDGQQIAASFPQSTGVTNIALLDSEGGNLREATGGDTIDTAPAWIPDAPRRLLFQSSGLARDEQGYIAALGNASIQMLNMDTGTVSPVLESATHDYLKPRVAPDGALLFIRRPYETPGQSTSSLFSDIFYFPFRLLRAIFHYLNFFSLMYSRKPLTSANGPSMKADIKQILLQGRRIDAEKALRQERPVHGIPSLAPADWELCRRDRQGNEQVLACNVASYDLCPDGSLIYSNGRGVFFLSPEGSAHLACQADLVDEVVAA